MLEGLEASEISINDFKNKNEFLRLDSDFFKKIYLQYDNLILKYQVERLDSISEILNGKTPNYTHDGLVKIIRSGDLNYKWLNDDLLLRSSQEDDLFYLKQNDVLVSSIGAGSIGKVDVFIKDFNYATVSEVTVLRTKSINPFYLAKYLETKFGQSFIEKNITGATGQLHLNKSSIKNIFVPILSIEFQSKIEIIFKLAHKKINQAKLFYSEAEKILLKELDLYKWLPTSKNNNKKTFSESFLQTGRLDAEYYQSKFDELERHLFNTREAIKLGSHLIFNKRGTQPLYTDILTGIRVLNSKHIRENQIDFTESRFGNPKETNPELQIKRDDVLINGTGVGTIGRSAVYLSDEPALPDNHVTILRAQGLDPIFLSVQLNSIIGKLQVEKYFKGSSGQIELYPSDINEFIIWKASEVIQLEIRHSIEESEKLRLESEALLRVARDAVEIAIEQDEATAFKFINES